MRTVYTATKIFSKYEAHPEDVAAAEQISRRTIAANLPVVPAMLILPSMGNLRKTDVGCMKITLHYLSVSRRMSKRFSTGARIAGFGTTLVGVMVVGPATARYFTGSSLLKFSVSYLLKTQYHMLSELWRGLKLPWDNATRSLKEFHRRHAEGILFSGLEISLLICCPNFFNTVPQTGALGLRGLKPIPMAMMRSSLLLVLPKSHPRRGPPGGRRKQRENGQARPPNTHDVRAAAPMEGKRNSNTDHSAIITIKRKGGESQGTGRRPMSMFSPQRSRARMRRER